MGKFRDGADTRALRFAMGFPLVLGLAFVICAFLVRADLPEPLAVGWGDGGPVAFAPFGTVVGAGAALIVLAGWAALAQAVPLSRPARMRRTMMGAGLALTLFIATVLAALLVGQLGLPDARGSRVDASVLALGSGAALALGIILGFVFKADERWSVDDDRALDAAVQQQLDPELAADTCTRWVHARSSVFVMVGIAAILPGALISIVLPWLGLLLAAVAVLAATFLVARIRIDRSGLRVYAGGFLRVIEVPAADIATATAQDVSAANFGGWGFRVHAGTRTMLVSSGPAVLIECGGGRVAAVSGGTAETAESMARTLARVAARARRPGDTPDAWPE